MTTYNIALLAGDGIGPEIMRQAEKVLAAIETRSDIRFKLTPAAFGASAWFETGHSLPQATLDICDQADAILKGTIGLNHADTEKIPVEERPERAGLLPLRKHLDTYANFRPVYLPKGLKHFSPLKPEIVGDGIDIMIIRELVGGLYFGKKKLGVDKNGQRYAVETLEYTEAQIERIMRVAFDTAQKRKGVLHNIHKSNVLKSSVLWNEIAAEVGTEYPNVKVEHMLVDAAATYLCLNPCQFDVMVMENMMGDILSDQGGGILGSLGLMPSACIGPDKAYYEPSHGSAPDIAGQNIANPYSMLGSVAMMMEYSFDRKEDSKAIFDAMEALFIEGVTTPDLKQPNVENNMISTDEFGDRVAAAISR
ncbi:MAG: 3-isopropylmalate dehydrogenase [Arenicellales bacterium]